MTRITDNAVLGIKEKAWEDVEELMGYKPIIDRENFTKPLITVHHVCYPAIIAAHKGLVELSWNRLTRDLIYRTTNHSGGLGTPVNLGKFEETINEDYKKFGITLKDSLNDY